MTPSATTDPRHQALMAKGVNMPNPWTVTLGPEVDLERIAGEDVHIYPGCCIHGRRTLIGPGTRLGEEGPVTLEDCALGTGVALKGGYFRRSVFLDQASMGSGAHVRAGCLLEEEAGGAHCVGLKQTILMPFVTLGSLINFCDCLMAGGTSRRNHSEVGSSYIHFNFTPAGDKTTPSLVGDVPRGVMLREPPIFLGGQGGMVGPLRLGFGNVVIAGCILRKDVPADNRLIAAAPSRGLVRPHRPGQYPNLRHILRNNCIYLANLAALTAWYRHIRSLAFAGRSYGPALHAAAMETLAENRRERLQRLEMLAAKLLAPPAPEAAALVGQALQRHWPAFAACFESCAEDAGLAAGRTAFTAAYREALALSGGRHVGAVQALPASAAAQGTGWLAAIVRHTLARVAALLPELGLAEGRPA